LKFALARPTMRSFVSATGSSLGGAVLGACETAMTADENQSCTYDRIRFHELRSSQFADAIRQFDLNRPGFHFHGVTTDLDAWVVPPRRRRRGEIARRARGR